MEKELEKIKVLDTREREKIKKQIENGWINISDVLKLKEFIEKYPKFSVFYYRMGEWETLVERQSYCLSYDPHSRKSVEEEAGIVYDYRDEDPLCIGRPYEVGYNGSCRCEILTESEIYTQND